MISEHSIHGINCLQSCRMEQRCCSGWELLSVLLLLECFVTPLLSMFLIPYQIWNTLETIVTVLEGFICDCCHSNGSFACSTCYCEYAIVVYLHILECRPWLNTLISGCFFMCENQTFSPSDEEVRRRGYIPLGYWVSSPCMHYFAHTQLRNCLPQKLGQVETKATKAATEATAGWWSEASCISCLLVHHCLTHVDVINLNRNVHVVNLNR
jgi:hypothetical protein